MKRIDCPNCGHSNPIMWQACEQCGFVLKYARAVSTAVEYVPCAVCHGTGLIYLDYLDGFEENPETQWLPCAGCDGTGQRDLAELRDEEFRRNVNVFIGGILEALL